MARKKPIRQPKRPSQPLRLVFDTDAHALMDTHCAASPRNEVCGVLVGFTGIDTNGRWTRVVGVIEGRHAREDQMSVTFTHETWDAVHAELAKRRDKARVIGWYHTHPDFGIFYSAPDVFVHRNFFGLEGQVGVVVDPVRDERGAFANTARGLQALPRYEVARQNRSGHLVHCAYVKEPLREARVEARAAAADAEVADSGGSYARTSLDSIEAGIARVERRLQTLAWVLIAGALLSTLLGLALGIWLGRRTAVLEVPRSALISGPSPNLNKVAEQPSATRSSPSQPPPSKAPTERPGGKP